MKRYLVLAIVMVGLGVRPLGAQVSGADDNGLRDPSIPPPVNAGSLPAAVQAGNEDFGARMARLEAENRRMQAELLEIQRQQAQRPAASVNPIALATAGETQPAVRDAGVTMPEVQSEVKRSAWSKGDFKVVPYGILWGNSVFSTQRTNVGTTTFFVESPTKQNDDEFIVDGRNTRIGIDVLGPRIPMLCCAQSGGKVEIDFQGATAGTENKGGVLLRHAYAEVKNDDFRLLAGQTWDVISPLNPGMLMYSVGWDAGNIGYRRAQFRGERFLAITDTELLTFQASINQNCFPDAITNVTGKSSPWPIVEGRVALTLGDRTGPDALPVTFGVSSHVGQAEFNYNTPTINLNNQRRYTWSLNADLRVPLTHRLGVQGEFFTGQDLSSFYGGIGQGIDPTTLDAIRSTGGWCELWYDWTLNCHSHFGYSLDDPNDEDLHTAGERSYNQVYYGNVAYDLTKQFLVGLEVSSWKTQYITWSPGESVRCEFVVKYGF
jgi:hypothetical protein